MGEHVGHVEGGLAEADRVEVEQTGAVMLVEENLLVVEIAVQQTHRGGSGERRVDVVGHGVQLTERRRGEELQQLDPFL